MKHIIALSGQRESGKNDSAAILTELANSGGLMRRNWKLRAFADPVKEIYCKAFGVDRDFIEKWKRVNTPPPGFEKTVRQSLVFIGDGFRSIRPNCWIERGIEGDDLILTDVRYYNEADAIRSVGGYNVILCRPGFENKDDNESERQTRYVTDQLMARGISGVIPARIDVSVECFKYDYFLINDGDLDSLKQKIERDLLPCIVNHFQRQGNQ